MIYREFGNTGKKVSLLGFGGNQFRHEDLKDDEGLDRLAELVEQAAARGINYFDCSPSYAKGFNEKILGKGLKKYRNKVYISAKSGLQIDRTADDIRKRIDTSLRNLDREVLDFYHVWAIMSWKDYEEVMAPNGIYEGIVKAKSEGLVSHICASLHCTDDEMLRIIEDGAFEGITIVFTAINYKSKISILKKAEARGMGIATMNSLAGGLIPKFPELFKNLSEDNRSVAQKALRFNASFSQISTILSGITNEKELIENVEAFIDPIKCKSPEHISFKLNLKKEICSGCNYCSGCPQNIPISSYLQAYNYLILTDSEKVESVEKVFRDIRLAGADPWNDSSCIHCGRCEKHCTRQLDIINRIEHIQELAERHFFLKKQVYKKIQEFDRLYEQQTIGIWPAAVYADKMLDFYGSSDFERRCVFFNSSKDIQGKEFRGKMIYGIDDVERMGVDVILITNWGYRYEIKEQLEKSFPNLPIIVLQDNEKDICWFI